MKNILSSRVLNIEESKTVGLASIINDLKNQGQTIISLNVGEPDFATPEPIKEATIAAIKENHTRYSLVSGVVQLRTEIKHKLKIENNIDVSIDQIVLSNGSKQTLYNIFQALLNPGDEVIIPVPYWVTFPESVKLAGGIPRFVKCDPVSFQIDLEDLEKNINAKTKIILVNTPNNPTGAIYPQETLTKIANIAKKHDLVIVSDEAYERLTYDEQDHFSIASLDTETQKRTITVQSFSKSYCMTGFRQGYMVAEKEICTAVNKLQGHLTGNNCTFSQYGAIRALQMDSSVWEEMKAEFDKRRKLAFNLFSSLFKCQMPQGAFYLFMNVEDHFKGEVQNCEQFASMLLKKAKVAVVPGIAFGLPGHIRLSYAASEADIQKAYEQIKSVL